MGDRVGQVVPTGVTLSVQVPTGKRLDLVGPGVPTGVTLSVEEYRQG
jgi:hypothetical protein